MLHQLMWEDFYHWICIFLVFTPTVVQTLSKCSKVDVCKCSTDEGTIDLWSLDGTGSNIPRFKDISITGGNGFTADWNPCTKWSVETPQSVKDNNCQNTAVCFKFSNLLFADIGDQETADFSFNSTSGTCVLSFTGKPVPSSGNIKRLQTADRIDKEMTSSSTTFSTQININLVAKIMLDFLWWFTVMVLDSSTSTDIMLQCDPHEEGRLESLQDPVNVPVAEKLRVPLTLYSKYACPIKSGLSIGSVLIIIFISLLVVYLVGGIIFNKYRKGVTGKEMIPNVNFWTDFPLLVKDGVIFSYQCCKNVCSRKRGSYESI